MKQLLLKIIKKCVLRISLKNAESWKISYLIHSDIWQPNNSIYAERLATIKSPVHWLTYNNKISCTQDE
jgi:hypothetical protein